MLPILFEKPDTGYRRPGSKVPANPHRHGTEPPQGGRGLARFPSISPVSNDFGDLINILAAIYILLSGHLRQNSIDFSYRSFPFAIIKFYRAFKPIVRFMYFSSGRFGLFYAQQFTIFCEKQLVVGPSDAPEACSG